MIFLTCLPLRQVRMGLPTKGIDQKLISALHGSLHFISSIARGNALHILSVLPAIETY